MSISPGYFITFEGIEGSGKTTQIARLAAYLEALGHHLITTKEPGGTEVGLKIRELLLDPQTVFSSDLTEICLFTADRLEHVHSVVKPSLALGKTVICDRYVDSTYAYQQGGRQLSGILVDSLCHLIDLRPDITVLLDLDPEEGLRRAKSRAVLDRFEEETLLFHQRVRAMYLSRAAAEPDRFIVVSVASASIDEVFGRVIEEVLSRLT